ncbi:toll/interleukin-1 receptor domain-containing protein, partial [Leptolyngbya cf. ectocarpi LEGE 11479]
MANDYNTLVIERVNVYIAYARNNERDASLVKTLVSKHLYRLWQSGIAKCEYEIPFGENFEKLTEERLRTADIILLMISPESMSSNYFLDTEVSLARARCDNSIAVVIPVLLRPYSLRNFPLLKGLQVLPRNDIAITLWPDQDAAFSEIASEIGA